ncbi:MAG: hypothetical protein WC914_02060 [Proteiniphilum sp.]
MRRIDIALIALTGYSVNVFSLYPGTVTEDNDRPNIIFILADDMGYGDIRSFNPASAIPTPNLDRLADEGMKFTE